MIEHFDIEELVCPHIYEKLGETAWRIIDRRLLEVMDWIRKMLGQPIYVNLPQHGLTQRGVRCNLCSLVRDRTESGVCYLSAHVLGAAFDFSVKNMNAFEVRGWIEDNQESLPHSIRLERDVTWVHLDVLTLPGQKIVYF